MAELRRIEPPTRMTRLVRAVIRRPKATLAVWLAALIVLATQASALESRLSPVDYVIPGTESGRAIELDEKHFGSRLNVAVLLEGPPRELPRQGRRLAHELERQSDVRVISPWSGAGAPKDLRPSPGRAMLVADFQRPPADAKKSGEETSAAVERTIRPPVRAYLTGQPIIGPAIQRESLDATKKAEGLALVLLVVVLLGVFRSAIAAAIPLAFGVAALVASFGGLSLMALWFPVQAEATGLASMIALALGVDYSLLLVSRFREELRGESEVGRAAEAATVAGLTAGRTVVFAGVTMLAAMVAALALAPDHQVVSTVVGVMIVTVVCVVFAVLVVPALLALLGVRIDRFRIGRRHSGEAWSSRFARRAGRRPALVVALLLVPLIVCAVPASALDTGIPSVDMLPDDNKARADFDHVSRVMGPGWGGQFSILVVAPEGAVTTARRLRRIAEFQQDLRRDRDVAAVIGPAVIADEARDLRETPKRVNREVAAGRGDLESLRDGLARAGAGVDELRAGLAQAAAAGGELEQGSGAARAGSAELRAGLDRASAGSEAIVAGTAEAGASAGRLAEGAAQASEGAARLAAGLEQAEREVRASLPRTRELAGGLSEGARGLDRLREPVQRTEERLAAARKALEEMSVGKADARYADALTAVLDASGSLSGRDPVTGVQVREDYRGVDRELADGAARLRHAASEVDAAEGDTKRLADGLARLAAGASELGDGARRLAAGNLRLAEGLARLERGDERLAAGLHRLAAGAGELDAGLARLSAGNGELAEGLASGYTRSAALSTGLGRAAGAVAKGARELGADQGGLRPLQKRSPRFFDSGYLTLAALDGAPRGDRNRAEVIVNTSRGGDAARILVVPKTGPNHPRTDALADRLTDLTHAFGRRAGMEAAVGGEEMVIIDHDRALTGRLLALIVGLMLITFLVLIVILRSIALPAVAVGLNLVTVGVAFAVMLALFQGSDPPLGGPGYIDATSAVGVFAIAFSLSIDYQVFLLARMREEFVRSGSPEAAIEHGLGRTARVITGAALIMTGVFAAFSTAVFIPLREFGIGLAVAVLLDATIVRLVLLPAVMRILGDKAWWMPRWLDRKLPSVQVEGSAPPASRTPPRPIRGAEASG